VLFPSPPPPHPQPPPPPHPPHPPPFSSSLVRDFVSPLERISRSFFAWSSLFLGFGVSFFLRSRFFPCNSYVITKNESLSFYMPYYSLGSLLLWRLSLSSAFLPFHFFSRAVLPVITSFSENFFHKPSAFFFSLCGG